MSGWTVITVRGAKAENYADSDWDGYDRGDATQDIIATMESDRRVNAWTSDPPQVYAYLNCSRYDFEFAEGFFEDYAEMIDDAVVLGANDTTDQGCARYYPRPDLGKWTDQYEEIEHGQVGQHALQVIGGRHGIIARDPFHDWTGRLDETYAENGENKL